MAAVLFNPAVLTLLENLAVTGASIYAQSQDAAKAGEIQKVIALAPTATAIAARYQQVTTVLGTAQAEGWSHDDARWTPVFAEADADLQAAEARLT